MKQDWVDHCLEMATRPATFYSGCRKIITGVMLEFVSMSDTLENELKIQDSGFTKSKLTMLRRLYWSDEHAAQVKQLWEGRLARRKYGSVSVSTYHHLTKGDPEKRSKRASVMGPCLLGVSATLLNSKGDVGVDAFYRTTELLKKFPADLVFMRDTVMPGIGVEVENVSYLRCHFANVTLHPMYVSTILPHLPNPPAAFERWRTTDERFWQWAIKWTARYVCDEYSHGIQKFAQALRVRKDALERIDGKKLKALQDYFRKNHPGYTRTRFSADGAEADDDEGED